MSTVILAVCAPISIFGSKSHGRANEIYYGFPHIHDHTPHRRDLELRVP